MPSGPSLVLVRWTDASFELDSTGKAPEGYEVSTVGWLVDENEGFISIAAERLPEGWRAVSHIPQAVVRDRTALEQVIL